MTAEMAERPCFVWWGFERPFER